MNKRERARKLFEDIEALLENNAELLDELDREIRVNLEDAADLLQEVVWKTRRAS